MSTSSRKKIFIIMYLGGVDKSRLSHYPVLDIKSLLKKDIIYQESTDDCLYRLTIKGYNMYKHILSLVELM